MGSAVCRSTRRDTLSFDWRRRRRTPKTGGEDHRIPKHAFIKQDIQYIHVQKFGISRVLFYLQKIYISKQCSVELSIHQRNLEYKMYQCPQKYCAAQLFLTRIIIRNVSYYYDF